MWIKYINHTRHQKSIKVCLSYKDLNSCHLCWHHTSLTTNTVFVLQRFHRWKTSFITKTAQHGDRTWGESEIQQKINRHAKAELLPSANGVSVTTMLLPLNIIDHIRKDTLIKELVLGKKIIIAQSHRWSILNFTEQHWECGFKQHCRSSAHFRGAPVFSSAVVVHQLAPLCLHRQSNFQSIGTRLGVHPTGWNMKASKQAGGRTAAQLNPTAVS